MRPTNEETRGETSTQTSLPLRGRAGTAAVVCAPGPDPDGDGQAATEVLSQRGDAHRASMRAGEIRSAAGAAALVGSLILVVLAGPVLAGERYYFRDLTQNHGPLLEAARSLLRAGDVPWLNPWSAGGKPFLANPNSLLLTPAGFLALFFPSGTGLTAAILFGSLLGAVFLVLLLRDVGVAPAGAAVGGLVYGLSGFTLSLATLPNLLAASSWITPALFFLGRARRSRRWLPAAVLSCAFVCVPCEPASALVLVVFAILPFQAEPSGGGAGNGRQARAGEAGGHQARGMGRQPSREGWGEGDRDSLSPARDRHPLEVRGQRARRPIAWTACVLGLGACAAAYQVLPAILWISASARGIGLPATETGKWSLRALRLPELVAPGFLGDPSRLGAWWGGSLFETGFPLALSLHVGAPALLLALWGTWRQLRDGGSGRSGWEVIRALSRRSGARGMASAAGGNAGISATIPTDTTITARTTDTTGGARGWLVPLATPMAGLMFLILAAGFPLAALTPLIPGASLFRYPEKFFLGTMLAIAFQAAVGADRLLGLVGGAEPGRGHDEHEGSVASEAGGQAAIRTLWVAASATALALLLASAAIRPAVAGLWFGLAPALRTLRVAAHQGAQIALALGAAEACLLVAAVFLARRTGTGRRGREAALVGAVTVALLAGALVPGGHPLAWRLRANPSVPASVFESAPFFAPHLEHLRAGGERVFRFERPSGFAVRNNTGTLADLFGWERRSLARSSASEFAAELVFDRSTDRLDPRGEDAALSFLSGRSAFEHGRFWDLASVRLVLSYAPIEAPALVLRDTVQGESRLPLLLYENTGALPRARVVARAEAVGSDREAFERILSSRDEHWHEIVRLESPQAVAGGRDGASASRFVNPDARPPLAPPEEAVERGLPSQTVRPQERWRRRARIVAHGAARFRIEVAALDGSQHPWPPAAAVPGSSAPIGPGGQATAAQWLVLAQSYVPGWRATVDGGPVPILRADGMNMAVPVPGDGAHLVEFRYFPPGLLAGTGLSLLALGLSLVWARLGRVADRRSVLETTPSCRTA